MRLTMMKRVRSAILIAAMLTGAGINRDFSNYTTAIVMGFVAGWIGGIWFMTEVWAWADQQRTGRRL